MACINTMRKKIVHTKIHQNALKREKWSQLSHPKRKQHSQNGACACDGGADARLDVVVVTLVLMLLLTPHQVGVVEAFHLRLHQVKRERGELGERGRTHHTLL